MLDQTTISLFAVPQVPTQNNSCDCGVYVLKYVEEVISCRSSLLIVRSCNLLTVVIYQFCKQLSENKKAFKGVRREVDGLVSPTAFKGKHVRAKRVAIRELIHELAEKNKEDQGAD